MPSTNDHSTVSTLNHVIGKAAARLLMQPGTYGGKTIDVPKGELGRGEQTFSALSEVVGREAAQRLCKHFGGCRFYVPKDAKGHLLDRNRRIVTAYNQGAGIHTLVSDFSLSDRRIRTILKETDMTD